MPVFLGGRKAKELYFGGRKIKEAWLNGKKVFSAGGIRAWSRNGSYDLWEKVHHQGFVYECQKAHKASSSTEPGNGWDSWSYWKQLGYAYEFGI